MKPLEEILRDEVAPPEVAPSAVRAAVGGRSLPFESEDAPEEPLAEPEAEREEPPPAAAVDRGVQADAEPDGEPVGEPDAFADVPFDTRLEALLFAASQPLSLRRLQSLLGDAASADVRAAIGQLEALYARENRAFGVQEVAGGFQLRTRPELAPFVARLGRRTDTDRLSSAALETLAVVAYRQPVLRADIEKIRGVASGEMLRGLIEKALVRVTGRADLPGAPLLYGTTPRFLEVFGLRDLRDLPADREILQRPL